MFEKLRSYAYYMRWTAANVVATSLGGWVGLRADAHSPPYCNTVNGVETKDKYRGEAWCRCRVQLVVWVNPFRTAVPCWGQTSEISSSLSPKRDCGSKGVKFVTAVDVQILEKYAWGVSALGWLVVVFILFFRGHGTRNTYSRYDK